MRTWWLLPFLAFGCGHGAARVDPNNSPADGGAPECQLDTTRCVAEGVMTCRLVEGVARWDGPAACTGDQTCRDDVCVDPTAKQLDEVAASDEYVDLLRDNTAWSSPLPWEQIQKTARDLILHGDASDLAYFTALRSIHLAVPQGHQSLRRQGGCRTADMFAQESSRFGACGRPHGDDVVVTFALDGNPLGLARGDRIVASGSASGPELLEAAARRPVCGASAPSASFRRTSAAASFFGTVPAGLELTVQPVDGGARRTVVVPPKDGPFISCQDPLGRNIDFEAQATVRSDGIAVIRLPRFYPRNPVSTTDVDALIKQMTDAVKVEFDKVKSAPAIIWDARSNYGGISLVGLAIAGGMPGARPTALSYCTARLPGTQPPQFDTVRYAEYSVTPGGPFAYAGKTVVLIDGIDYSAADYFPYAVRQATDVKLVGTPSAGAYGGPGPEQPLSKGPAVLVNFDLNRCVDGLSGEPLEGRSVMPDVVVEYEPADLAVGVDTVLEAGAKLVQ